MKNNEEKSRDEIDFTPVYTDVGKLIKRSRDFGKVIISNNCTMVSCELLDLPGIDYQDPNFQKLYTIDSDFMIRSWDLGNDGDCF